MNSLRQKSILEQPGLHTQEAATLRTSIDNQWVAVAGMPRAIDNSGFAQYSSLRPGHLPDRNSC